MPEMSYLLKNGLIATFTIGSDRPIVFKSDVLVHGSNITQIAENITAKDGVTVIDCKGKWIAPGMVDTHRFVCIEYM